MAEAFLRRFAGELKREPLSFAAPTLQVLESYDWPGNVRQLKNAVERMVVLAQGRELTPELLPPEVQSGPAEDADDADDLSYREALVRFKRRTVKQALVRTGGNQTRAAELLGLQRSYLNRLIKELGL